MSAKILKFARPVNGVTIEQKLQDGSINGTAMCVAHGKDISDWLALDSTFRLVVALAKRLKVQANSGISPNSVKTRVSRTFPSLVISKPGSPANGGGTWIHPKLAVNLAQWCNEEFALQVSDWIEEWLLTGRNPIKTSDDDLERQWKEWQQRYDIRTELKDFLRPELMNAVVQWAIDNGANPRKLCSEVHDAMNERIQGAKSKQIRLMGGLPFSALIRDHFGASPLVGYSAINKLGRNAIVDRGIEPVQAVHEACDHYLGKAYVPKLVLIHENLYSQGRRLRVAKRDKRFATGVQLDLWGSSQAS